MPNLTVKDLDKLQAQHPDYQMELVDGEIITRPLARILKK